MATPAGQSTSGDGDHGHDFSVNGSGGHGHGISSVSIGTAGMTDGPAWLTNYYVIKT